MGSKIVGMQLLALLPPGHRPIPFGRCGAFETAGVLEYMRLNPNHLRSHALLMAAYIRVGDRPSSYKHYQRVMSIDPAYYAEKSILYRRNENDYCS